MWQCSKKVAFSGRIASHTAFVGHLQDKVDHEGASGGFLAFI